MGGGEQHTYCGTGMHNFCKPICCRSWLVLCLHFYFFSVLRLPSGPPAGPVMNFSAAAAIAPRSKPPITSPKPPIAAATSFSSHKHPIAASHLPGNIASDKNNTAAVSSQARPMLYAVCTRCQLCEQTWGLCLSLWGSPMPVPMWE